MNPTRSEMIKQIVAKDPQNKLFNAKYYKKFTDEQILKHWQKITSKPTEPKPNQPTASKEQATIALSGFDAVNQK